jgi:single-strand DNA-binding protein
MFTGRLTKDPEPKVTTSGVDYTNFSIAVNGFKKDAPATFLNCVAWKTTANFICKYMKKGMQVLITESSLDIGEYEKDGVKKQAVKINVHQIRSLSKIESGDKPEATSDEKNFDDIPF